MKWNFLYQITAASRIPDWGATDPRSPFSLSSVLNWICWTPPTPNKTPGYATAVDPKFSALDSKAYQWKISLGSSHLRLLHQDITTAILWVSEFCTVPSGRFTAKIQNVFLSPSMSALLAVSKQAVLFESSDTLVTLNVWLHCSVMAMLCSLVNFYHRNVGTFCPCSYT